MNEEQPGDTRAALGARKSSQLGRRQNRELGENKPWEYLWRPESNVIEVRSNSWTF